MDALVHKPSVDVPTPDAVVELVGALVDASGVANAVVPLAEDVAEQPHKNAGTANEETTTSALALRRITDLPPEWSWLQKMLTLQRRAALPQWPAGVRRHTPAARYGSREQVRVGS